MTFYSLPFAVFMASLWLVSRWAKPIPKQWIFLAGSYFFYWTWSQWFFLLLIAISLFDYFWGKLVARKEGVGWLGAGILVNLAVLAICKIGLPESQAVQWSNPTGLLVPIGVSFFSFQGISYLVDIRRGFVGADNPRPFLLYMAFWPTILAGPICRAPEMLPQLESAQLVPRAEQLAGLHRVIFGLFLKLILAETLWVGILPGQGLQQALQMPPGQFSAADVFVLAFGLGLWLYLDFSGYTHVACGLAKIVGIRLRENFRFPYHSTTPQEFWTRWHMSLSSWIRDYVFFPLSTLRRSHGWRYLALFSSLVAFGMWHGLALNFLLWGSYQGAILVLWRWLGPDKRSLLPGSFRSRIVRSLSWMATLLLVSLGWILFFAPFTLSRQLLVRLSNLSVIGGLSSELYELVILLWLLHLLMGWLLQRASLWKSRWWAWGEQNLPGPAALVLFLVILALSENPSPFAYVRF